MPNLPVITSGAIATDERDPTMATNWELYDEMFARVLPGTPAALEAACVATERQRMLQYHIAALLRHRSTWNAHDHAQHKELTDRLAYAKTA